MSRKVCVGVVVVIVGLLAAPACTRAGGLIQSLPADGSYVVFKVSSELDFQGNLQSFERELKLASVGKQDIEGEPGRWIEVATEFMDRKILAKLLIAEKYLNADENPFDHIVKAWGRGQDGEVREVPDDRLRRLVLFAFTVPHFDKPEKKDKETVKTELGEFECDRLAGKTEILAFQDNKATFEGDLWVTDKVPFGLARAKVKGDLGIGQISTELVVLRKGSDAKSELPDVK